MNSMIAARVLAWRVIRHYFSSWKGLFIAIITPACMLLFLGPSIGNMVQDVALNGHNVGYMTYFLPGIIALTIFYGALFTSGNMIVMDRVTGFADMIKVSPNSAKTITMGYVLGSAIVGSIQGLIFLMIGLLFSPAFSVSVLSILAIALMIAGTAFFGAMGFLIGTRVSFDNFSLIFALISIPFVYTSTIFVPIGYFPTTIQFIILINPISLLVDLARAALLGLSSWNIYFSNIIISVLLDGILCGVLFGMMILTCIKTYPGFTGNKRQRTGKEFNKDSASLDYDFLHSISKEIGIKNLEEWWPLLKEGRIDELLIRFPEEKVKKILEMVKQAMVHEDRGFPANDH